ncbi:DUF6476 family protein [Frigidibacter oleivorans]|uniref:DUF6476 family protein n=1 Tax=Frigidibacter oleivorans TaxID=2487129 RepID=UPI000F8C4128|nr:DUF6476 family protein [Frigidibacter oleivorans]
MAGSNAGSDKGPPQDEYATPPELRFLKTLVTVLAGVMIAGLLAIVALLVIRFSQPLPEVVPSAGPTLPANIALPEGETARAVTFGTGWIAVVTGDDEILILDGATGALRQRVRIGG